MMCILRCPVLRLLECRCIYQQHPQHWDRANPCQTMPEFTLGWFPRIGRLKRRGEHIGRGYAEERPLHTPRPPPESERPKTVPKSVPSAVSRKKARHGKIWPFASCHVHPYACICHGECCNSCFIMSQPRRCSIRIQALAVLQQSLSSFVQLDSANELLCKKGMSVCLLFNFVWSMLYICFAFAFAHCIGPILWQMMGGR